MQTLANSPHLTQSLDPAHHSVIESNLNQANQWMDPTRHSVIEPDPTQTNQWVDPTHHSVTEPYPTQANQWVDSTHVPSLGCTTEGTFGSKGTFKYLARINYTPRYLSVDPVAV